jgi:UDP-glucose-4-epimerase GalE
MLRKSVLVTGGAGYIGSHAAKALAGHGFVPVVLDTLALGHRRAVKWGPFIEGDAGDEPLVRRIISEYDIEAVIHFAGNAYVGESIENPRKYLNENVATSLGLLNAMVDSGVDKLVFSSTCATYGIPDTVPIDENHPQSPINPYGESKLFVERALKWYSHAHVLRYVSLRFFNAAGGDPDGDTGESHIPETHLIPLAIQTAMGLRPNLTVFGTDFATRDGTAIRDYVHVSDLAAAHVAALRFLEDGGDSTAFNLGTESGYSVRDVIHCVQRVVGRPVTVVDACRRTGDPAVLIAKAEKARRVLGWYPKFSNLDSIVETAYRWQLLQSSALWSEHLVSHTLSASCPG